MSDIHGRASVRESRDDSAPRRWLSGYDPGDGRGPIGPKLDATDLFGPTVLMDAWHAATDQAEAEFAVERATGQRQLDSATALMTEAAELFEHYARHHTIEADAAKDPAHRKARRERAGRNTLMATRLREWLAGKDVFSVSLGEAIERLEGMACLAQPFAIPAEIAENGDLVPVEDEKTREDCRDRFDNVPRGGFHSGGLVPGGAEPPSLFRPGERAARLSPPQRLDTADRTDLFRLQTPDPRFDPTQPVLVNGFPYRPAKEA